METIHLWISIIKSDCLPTTRVEKHLRMVGIVDDGLINVFVIKVKKQVGFAVC